MERAPVRSTAIRSVGYERSTLTLEIEFQSGDVYWYRPVPEATYRALVSAPSVGSYFQAHVRDRFPTTRIR